MVLIENIKKMKYLIPILITFAISVQIVIAKEITLDSVRLNKDNPIYVILNDVIHDADSVLHSTNNMYTVTFLNKDEGYDVYVSLRKNNMLTNYRKYIGYQSFNNNIIIYAGEDRVSEFDRTNLPPKQFLLDKSGPKPDGVISWIYYVREDKVWKIAFDYQW